jgi:hypothetical protein
MMRLLVTVCLLAGTARADDLLGGPELAAANRSDAAHDRGLLVSTARALDAGEVDLTVRGAYTFWGRYTGESLTAGIGHGIELAVGTMSAMHATSAGIKLELVERPTWAIAATASITSGTGTTEGGYNNPVDETLVVASIRLTTCYGDTCSVQLTGGIGGGVDWVRTPQYRDVIVGPVRGPPVQLDGNVTIGTGRLRPMVELEILEGIVAIAGVRLASKHVSIDVGLGRAGPPDTRDFPNNEGVHAATFGFVGLALAP